MTDRKITIWLFVAAGCFLGAAFGVGVVLFFVKLHPATILVPLCFGILFLVAGVSSLGSVQKPESKSREELAEKIFSPRKKDKAD